ncbi:hypothetical protein EV421DRAFT_1858443, partial [Armillaria borealis]
MSSFSVQLRAARDIEAGEKIFTNYTGILRPTTERAEDLGIYAIKCTCRACLDPVKNAGACPDTWIDPAVYTLTRIQEEGLEGLEEYYKTLHQLYNAYVYQNDEKKALMYGEKLWMANLAEGRNAMM